MRCSALLAAIAVGAGCGQDPISVGAGGAAADYNRGELLAAVDRFVAGGRSPSGFGVLAREVATLRRHMDETVAEEAERRMLVLALDPVEILSDRPLEEQVAALATTVWPFALRQSLGDPPATGILAERERALEVRDGENADAYLERLCGGVLAVDCKLAVPELRGAIVRARAVEQLTARVRSAIQACAVCGGDPSWAEAVARWEALDRMATASADSDEQRARPERWPMAGAGAEAWPEVPLLEIESDGDAVLDGVVLSPAERTRMLRRARDGADTLGVHLLPDARADQLAAVVSDAGKAGFRDVVLAAREPRYPWRLRGYRLRARGGTGPRVPWRPADTVQVVLRALDASGAGDTARL